MIRSMLTIRCFQRCTCLCICVHYRCKKHVFVLFFAILQRFFWFFLFVFTARCTMHSAKRGLAIACRPSVCLSVCPSVTLVICDHIGWKSWKLTARTISPTPLLLVAERRSTYSQGNMGKFGGTRGGVGKKWHAGEQKRQYLKRVKLEEKLVWTAYRNSLLLFRTVPSPTPNGLLFPQNLGFATPTQNCNLKLLANEC